MPCIMRTTSCAWFLGEGAGVNSIEVKTHFGNEMHEDGETEKKKNQESCPQCVMETQLYKRPVI